MKATNGTAPHTMMIAATKKKLSGSMSHEWPSKSRPNQSVRMWLSTPYCVSKIQPQTIVADSGGIAQARSRPTDTIVRSTLPSRFSSRATRVPSTIVVTTHTAAKTTERPSTPQNSGSVRIAT